MHRSLTHRRLRSPFAMAAAAAALLVLFGLGYWAYSGYKKRQLQESVFALVGEATSRARDALAVREPGVGELERLEAHHGALAAAAQRLAGLDVWRNAPLSDAAQQYIDETHALLRRLIGVQRARDALLASVNALTGHIGAARGRSSDWIREAVALKQQMDRDFFDYRLAAGGLQKSLQALPQAARLLAPLVAPASLIDEAPLAEARTRLTESTAQLTRQVEAARQLPVPR